MNNVKNMLMLGLLSVALLLGGCSEVEKPTGPSYTDIEGSYSLEGAYISGQELESSALKINFSEGGTGYTVYEGIVEAFEWTVQGDVLDLNLEGETTEMVVGISGNWLTLEWDDDIEDIGFLKKGKHRKGCKHHPKKKFIEKDPNDKRDLLELEERERHMMRKLKERRELDEKRGKCDDKDHEGMDRKEHDELHKGDDERPDPDDPKCKPKGPGEKPEDPEGKNKKGRGGKHKDHDGKGKKDHDGKKKGKYRKMLKLVKEGQDLDRL